MRYIYLTIIALALSLSPILAQSDLEMGLKEYERFHYAIAIEYLEKAISQDPQNEEVIEKIAHSYRKINDSRNAEVWYAKLVQFPYSSPEDKLYYAQALAMNGRYEESRKWYAQYAREVRHDERGKMFTESYEDTAHFHQDSHRYQIELAPFNSPQADFSPMYYREHIIFCSNRENNKNIFAKRHNWNKALFLDLYKVQGRAGTPEPFHENLNSKYHEGPTVFYNGYRNIIFTRNNYHQGKYKTSSDGTNKLKLFLADVSNGEWTNIREFPYNSDEYSVGHPAMSTDGTTLYFVSDMPGSLGGTDIFMSTLQSGIWSRPINLGPGINTQGNEMFPFVDANNNLYFSSNGIPGLGGLDIFMAKNIDGKLRKPQNIGVPINSSQDDFGIIIDVDRAEGYFSSNREGGVGDDDIYWFKANNCELVAIVVDSLKNKVIKDAAVQITEEGSDREVIYVNETDSTYSFRTSFRTSYTLKAFKEGYAEGVLEISEDELVNCRSGEAGVKDTVIIYLVPPNAPELLTSSDKNKVPPKNVKIPPYYKRLNLDTASIYAIENIYYDLDKYYIRPDAAATLNELLEVLYAYPNMRLLLSSHTDSRASYGYNVVLSKRRSQSAYQYLINRGISPDRLKINYFGETRLVTPCPDGVPCTEPDHQLNRRTEIIVLKE